MFKIRNSFAECSSCKLIDSPSCILETNSRSDLSEVEVIFIAENPGLNEVEEERPLVGKSGKIFREFFNDYINGVFKYLITNTVLCLTLDENGKTSNPDDETIEKCKINCFKIIELCQPRLLVLMGSTPMKAFNIAKSGITSLRGKFFKWNNIDVLLTIHPSYIARGHREALEDFKNDIITARNFLLNKTDIVTKKDSIYQTSVNNFKGPHYYRIPEKFYSSEYRLVETQFLRKSEEVLYVFRDSKNNKIYHKENSDYFAYTLKEGEKSELVVPFERLQLIKVPYKKRYNLNQKTTYLGDIALDIKHYQDYYLLKKENDANILDMNIMYLDIEVLMGEEKTFPHPIDAKYPICLITYVYHGKTKSFVLDNESFRNENSEIIKEDENIIICKTETELIKNWIKDLHSLDPDILSGYNSNNFDFPYIYTRSKKLKIPMESFSKFGEFKVDFERKTVEIPGFVIVDQLLKYRKYSQGEKTNFRLGTIAEIELGETKLDIGKDFRDMYINHINEFIDYNIRDTILLEKLENKLKHIALVYEINRICKVNFRGSNKTMGQLDSLLNTKLKSMGLASKNGPKEKDDVKFPGAYVKEPIVGIHDWIVDFDFTSLYPSIILTFNIGPNTFLMKFKNMEDGYNLLNGKLSERVDIIFYNNDEAIEKNISREELLKIIDDKKLTYTINGCFFKSHEDEMSYYSILCLELLEKRKEYKKLMFKAIEEKNESDERLFNTRQLTYKILANALYGVLGNKYFRFFNIDCASSITLSGREVIKTSILHGNEFVKSLKNNSKIEEPPELTAKEVYGDMKTPTPFVITSDTDSLFVCYKDLIDKNKSKKEILEMMDNWNLSIQNYLNKDIVEKLVERHNVNLKYNRLNLKNELIIRRGIFLAKKRYSIYIIKKEGKEVSRVENTGSELKRSEFSFFTKSSLSELLEVLLKSEKINVKDLFEFIDNKELEFLTRIKSGLKEIAKACSFSKKLSEYKNPESTQHMNAMLNWNKLQYEAFVPGSKGYLFTVNGLDPQKTPKEIWDKYVINFIGKNKKLEVIAIPDEEYSLPPYYIVNIKKMMEFAWNKRVLSFLDPIIKIK